MRAFLYSVTISTLLAGVASAQETPQPLYSERGSYAISSDENITAGVALGDIDGDGDLDLIESNGRHWAHASFVYFNAANRGFTKRIQLGDFQTTGYRVELMDMDGDGDLDVVMAADRLPNKLYFLVDEYGVGWIYLVSRSNSLKIKAVIEGNRI